MRSSSDWKSDITDEEYARLKGHVADSIARLGWQYPDATEPDTFDPEDNGADGYEGV